MTNRTTCACACCRRGNHHDFGVHRKIVGFCQKLRVRVLLRFWGVAAVSRFWGAVRFFAVFCRSQKPDTPPDFLPARGKKSKRHEVPDENRSTPKSWGVFGGAGRGGDFGVLPQNRGICSSTRRAAFARHRKIAAG